MSILHFLPNTKYITDCSKYYHCYHKPVWFECCMAVMQSSIKCKSISTARQHRHCPTVQTEWFLKGCLLSSQV